MKEAAGTPIPRARERVSPTAGSSLLSILPALLAAAALDVTAADWPGWRGQGRAGEWLDVELPPRFDADTVVPKWKVSIGGGYSGIAVWSGRVFTMDRRLEPESRERVICVDAASGRTLWTHDYAADYGDMDHGNGPRSTPAIHDGLAYALGSTGRVTCLEARSGEVRWELDTAGKFRAKPPIWGHAASPLVHAGLVVVFVGGRPGATLMAFDRVTGEERWRALEDRPGYSSPIVSGTGESAELLVWTADNVVSLAPLSGEVNWAVPFRTSNYDVSIISPVVDGGRLFVSGYWDGARTYRLRGDEPPELLWENRVPSCLMATPLTRGDHIYALDRRQGLLCIEWRTGEVLWSDDHRTTPRGRNPHASLVWAGGDRAVMLNALGELVLARLRPAGFVELGRKKIIGKTWAHPAFAGQSVFARSDTELVRADVRPGGPEK